MTPLRYVEPNAYNVEFPVEYGVFDTFNVADLSPHFEENEEILSLSSNSNQHGEDDGDYLNKPLEMPPNGPAKVIESKKVREVHAMARNHMNKVDNEQASSSRNLSNFIALLE